MSSFKQLAKEGTLKRVDGYRVNLANVVIDPEFNTRAEGTRLDQHISEIATYLMNGGQLPAIEVTPLPDGKVQVVDGHCRLRAYQEANARGAEFEWIDVRAFLGNDADRVARIASSNEGLKLTSIETAQVYKRLRGYNLLAAEIARRVNKTATHVGNLLLLADAPEEIQSMVTLGDISATLAIDTIKEHGDQALEVLRSALAGITGNDADDAPRQRVSPAKVRPWKLSGANAKMTLDAIDHLTQSFDFEVNATLQDDAVEDTRPITLSKAALLPLWEAIQQFKGERGK